MNYDSIISKYNVFIFDVDGTLYHQFPVRLIMMFWMIFDTVLHPSRIKLLLSLLYFRKRRRHDQYKTIGFDRQVSTVAKKKDLDPQILRQYLTEWLFEKPLSIIPKFRNKHIIDFINSCKNNNKVIVIYSDYPAESKIDSLKLTCDYIFYPGHGVADELKPSKKVMSEIMDTLGVISKEILYIGDDKVCDGGSAKLAGIVYLDVNDFDEKKKDSEKDGK